MDPFRRAKLLRVGLTLLSAYYIVGGVWPLVHIESFMAVTGPKTDLWLVQTVGALLLLIGLVIAMALKTKKVGLEIAFLAVGGCLTLATTDLVFVSRGVISPIYLLDAVAEFLLASTAFIGSRYLTTDTVLR